MICLCFSIIWCTRLGVIDRLSIKHDLFDIRPRPLQLLVGISSGFFFHSFPEGGLYSDAASNFKGILQYFVLSHYSHTLAFRKKNSLQPCVARRSLDTSLDL